MIIIAGGTLYLIVKALVVEIVPGREKTFLRFQEYRKNQVAVGEKRGE